MSFKCKNRIHNFFRPTFNIILSLAFPLALINKSSFTLSYRLLANLLRSKLDSAHNICNKGSKMASHCDSKLSLKDFLIDHARQAISYDSTTDKSEHRVFNIFIGNEASDADSIISALCHSYLSYKTTSWTQSKFIPLVAVSKQDLIMRQDVEVLLSHVGVSVKDLLSLEEFPSTLSDHIVIETTLLDHNVPTIQLESRFKGLHWQIVSIVDHHQDQGQCLHLTSDKRLIAFDAVQRKATVGSSCTLIYDIFKSKINWTEEKEVAILLLGVILLDTYSIDPRYSKARELDIQAIQDLSTALSIAEPLKEYHESLFVKLSGAKFDRAFWESLSVEDCLRYDYKRFAATERYSVGISSILLPVMDFLALKTADELLHSFTNAFKSVHCIAIMSFVTNPTHQRALLLVHRSAEERQAAKTFLMSPEYSLDLSEITAADSFIDSCERSEGYFVAVYQQRNALATRKTVAPLLVSFFEQLSK